MWVRYCKQRNLDKFVHFLKCASEIRPPVYIQSLPVAMKISNEITIEINSDDDFVNV